MGRIASSGEASSVTQPGQKMSGWYAHASHKDPDRGWLLTVHGRKGDDVMDGDEDGHGDEGEGEGADEDDGGGDG